MKNIHPILDWNHTMFPHVNNFPLDTKLLPNHLNYITTQRGLVVRAKYFGISHAQGHRFRTAVSKA